MSAGRLQITIDSRLDQVAAMAAEVRRACARWGTSPQATDEIELAVVEAVNNAIEHAYGSESGGSIEVVLEADRAGLRVEVRDEGIAIPLGVLEQAGPTRFDCADTNSLPEGGMGLHVIKQLMDEVHYQSYDGRNVLRLLRRTPGKY